MGRDGSGDASCDEDSVASSSSVMGVSRTVGLLRAEEGGREGEEGEREGGETKRTKRENCNIHKKGLNFTPSL